MRIRKGRGPGKLTQIKQRRGRLEAMKKTIRLKIEAQNALEEFKKKFGWKNPSWQQIAKQYNTTMENLYDHRRRIMRDLALEKLLKDVDTSNVEATKDWTIETPEMVGEGALDEERSLPILQENTDLVH
jgi:acyl-CoA reductase-like NAD-dependent aldehyde dehydrogenase